jgi:hypothetical protein
MPKPALEPPGFFNTNDGAGPGLAFHPLPAIATLVPGPREHIVEAQLILDGQRHPIGMTTGDVQQLVEFLLDCLEHLEPDVAPASDAG